MTRRFFIAIVFATALLSAAAARATPVLQSEVVVNDDMIHLGDIFANAGDKADVAVAAAPKPGRQAVFDAAWLANIAHANALEWTPAAQTDHVTVERAGHAVPASAIEDAVKKAATEKAAKGGMGGKIQVSLDNRNIALYADPDDGPSVQVRDIWIDKEGSRFTATVAAGPDASAQVVKVSGQLYEVTSIPVLTRRVGSNDVIGPEDIRFIEVRSDSIESDVITDPDALIGMSARRQAVDNVPLRAHDFRAPVVVTKGSLVSMVLQTPYMQLTAQGRAIEDGAKGQVIKVMNTQSKMTVDATVDGPARVVVQAPLSMQTAARGPAAAR